MSAFEKYRSGEPLNEELAAVRDGQPLAMEPLHPLELAEAREERMARPGLLDWEPTREQLGWLQELRVSQGWDVLMRLFEKRLEIARERAIRVSESQPLENKDAISMAWAYHGVLQSVVRDVTPMVNEQLKRLRKAEG